MSDHKKASIMIFHDELCQVFNGLMTALSFSRQSRSEEQCPGDRPGPPGLLVQPYSVIQTSGMSLPTAKA